MTQVTAESLREAVVAAEATLKQADTAFFAAKGAAERVRYAAQAPAHATVSSLEATYKERAHELAIEAGSCPYTRSGSHMDPDEVTVREDGIWLSWDINGNYAPAYFHATWEALLAAASEETEQ